ncbi:metallophosphoesterase [Flagellimonas sp. 389]|uniref:metallophosphoesterase family protein n=1 Tax=Flagellimonas sp. 389 TaxID=2835862 RepID=UPI001BD5A1CB|nr:metallophosphoesterase [Flagellimonas sp. 389]MBS9462895.1 metallophosphoesterase [Flagellimonas sp. 389]
MKGFIDRHCILCCLLMLTACKAQQQVVMEQDAWTFVSVPDFLNKDTYYPQPGFEEGLSFFLQAVKAENPDFVLVPGDLVNGRWPSKLEPTKEGIEAKAAIFYPAWKARLEAHGLNYYVAIGDHEVGDNPWPEEKAKLVPVFEEQFRKYMQMPNNGPDHMKGLAYYFIHKNSLFVSLDVFEPGKGKEGNIVAQVTGKQLEWLDSVLVENKGVNHVVVMGHTPILGPVNRLHSSGMMLEKGRQSPLWKTLSKYNIDLYLCGEVHAITCTEKDGVQQIAHGSLFGWNPTVNYLVGKVSEDKIELELKEIDIVPEVIDRKSLSISFTTEAMKEGFRTVGTLTLDKVSGKVSKKKTGCFLEVNPKN